MILGIIALTGPFDLTVNPWLFPGCQKRLFFNVQQIRTKISHLFPDLSQTTKKRNRDLTNEKALFTSPFFHCCTMRIYT